MKQKNSLISGIWWELPDWAACGRGSQISAQAPAVDVPLQSSLPLAANLAIQPQKCYYWKARVTLHLETQNYVKQRCVASCKNRGRFVTWAVINPNPISAIITYLEHNEVLMHTFILMSEEKSPQWPHRDRTFLHFTQKSYTATLKFAGIQLARKLARGQYSKLSGS